MWAFSSHYTVLVVIPPQISFINVLVTKCMILKRLSTDYKSDIIY
jgi:hypothetical protein